MEWAYVENEDIVRVKGVINAVYDWYCCVLTKVGQLAWVEIRELLFWGWGKQVLEAELILVGGHGKINKC